MRLRDRVLFGAALVALASVAWAQGTRIEPGNFRALGAITAGGSIIASFNGANVILDNSVSAADNRKFLFQSIGQSLGISAINDALNATSAALAITRTGTQVTGMTYGPASGATSGHTFQGGPLNTNAAQPGFLAYNSTLNTFLSTPGAQTIPIDAETYDSGVFGSNTFTAPVSGVYEVCASVQGQTTTGTADVILTTSAGLDGYLALLTTSAVSSPVQACYPLSLAASETVSLTTVVAGGQTVTIIGGAIFRTWLSARLVP